MTSNAHRFMTATAAAVGGLLAAMSLSSAIANADVWTIDSAVTYPYPEVLSVSGIPPFDQSVLEQGTVGVTHVQSEVDTTYIANGVLATTQSFGFSNEEFIANSAVGPDFPDHSVVDIMSFGGFQNIYVDLPGAGTGGVNAITDTLVTPFGTFDLPVTFDAAALDTGMSAASVNLADLLEPGGFAAALDADWATLVADFGSLF
jgi:hypothetical protein